MCVEISLKTSEVNCFVKKKKKNQYIRFISNMFVLTVNCGVLGLVCNVSYSVNTLTAFLSGRLHGVRDMVPGNERKVGAFYLFIYFITCVGL